jgi:DNA polymerase (family 10)
MNNAQIAAALDEIADLLEFQGANPFRVRAYRNGARTIGDLTNTIESVLKTSADGLTEISGIGADLAEKIETLATTGKLPFLEELRSQVPASVMALLRIPGLGPKKAAKLFHDLNVKTLDELRAACNEHRVRDLKGFGDKTEQLILAGIDIAAAGEERVYWSIADQFAQELRAYFADGPKCTEFVFAGSYRRGRETVGDLDLLVVADNSEGVMNHLAAYPQVAQVLGRGETKMSVRLQSGLQLDLRVVPAKSFGAALQYFTGSKAHNIVVRGLAKDRGLKINEYGVFRIDGEKEIYVCGKNENEVYHALDLPRFPPEIREARQEFDWAKTGQLPKLVELSDMQGDLHSHTTATDGSASIQEMAAAAKARGWKYLAITDHSKRVTMANGLDSERLRSQWQEIDRINQTRPGILLLKGVEVDILEKGGLDLNDDVLAEADWVVASVHYGQNQPREQITRRIVDALANPNVWAIAHPTGRIINRRPAYDVDLDAVFAAAKQHRKFLELNANPARLDLDDVACAAAKRHGVPIVISTDAHSENGFDVMRYGILQARRGGLTATDVVNTRPWEDVGKMQNRSR